MKKLLAVAVYALLAACTAFSHRTLEEQDKHVVEPPYAGAQMLDDNITPDVYALVAARTANKMLDDTADIYEKETPLTLYIMKVKKADETLPDGFYQARRETKEILEGSGAFTIVNKLNDAQYYLEISIYPIPLVDKDVPGISYHLTLFSNDNTKIGEWAQMIKQVQNDDKSWW